MNLEQTEPHYLREPAPAVSSPPPITATHGAGWKWLWLLLILLGIGGGVYYIYNATRTTASPSGRKGAGGTLPVVASAAIKGNLPIFLTGLGSVTPFNTVTIKSRVDGQINKINFVEGQDVKEGDPLIEIDPRPYQVQLTQAQGQLAKDQAQYNNSKTNVERDKQAGNAVSKQQVDTDTAAMDQAMGAMEIDKGQIDSANLNLTYCKITSPITGRIGLRLVDQGNIVHANDTTGLAVVTQVRPIAVVFTLPEDDIAAVQKRMAEAGTIEVNAYARDDKTRLAAGKLIAIDNQIDPNSGTVKLKASFDNKDNALFPNQFVNAKILVDTIKNTVLVPTAAVQHGPQSTFVYVARPDASPATAPANSNGTPAAPVSTVQLRNVTVARSESVGPNDVDMSAIESGINPGDIVVTDGVDKLEDGSKVIVHRGDLAGTTRPASSQSSGSATKPHHQRSE